MIIKTLEGSVSIILVCARVQPPREASAHMSTRTPAHVHAHVCPSAHFDKISPAPIQLLVLVMNDSINVPESSENATNPNAIPPQVYVIAAFSFLSLFGCLAILLTYSLYQDLRSLPGKILMNLASAILVASFFTIVSLFVVDQRAVCKAIAILLHYAYTCEFFWMSVLSFEIARALRELNAAHVGNLQRRGRLRFLAYLFIGWGLPVLVIAYTSAINFASRDYVQYGGPDTCEEAKTCPRYCFVTEIRGYIFSIFVPVGVSLLFNLVTSVFIGYIITRASVNRYKLNMNPTAGYIRVVISVICITGVTYVLSAIFLSIHSEYGHSWALYMFTALGTAQGFLVSIVFIFKSRIAEMYKASCVTLLGKCTRTERDLKQVKKELQNTNLVIK